MSGRDWGGELGRSVGDIFAGHEALPPRQKNIQRAALGAGLWVACLYTAWFAKGFTGMRAGALVGAFFHSPAHATSGVWWPVVIWGCAALIGTLWLVVGVPNSRGPRDTMGIFWSGVRAAIPAALLLFGVYFPNWPFANLILQCGYLSFLAFCAMELTLLVLGPHRRSLGATPHGQARTATPDDLKRTGILR